MTVNELLQKLVELARDGKGQLVVKAPDYDFNNDEWIWMDIDFVDDWTYSEEVLIG